MSVKKVTWNQLPTKWQPLENIVTKFPSCLSLFVPVPFSNTKSPEWQAIQLRTPVEFQENKHFLICGRTPQLMKIRFSWYTCLAGWICCCCDLLGCLGCLWSLWLMLVLDKSSDKRLWIDGRSDFARMLQRKCVKDECVDCYLLHVYTKNSVSSIHRDSSLQVRPIQN